MGEIADERSANSSILAYGNKLGRRIRHHEGQIAGIVLVRQQLMYYKGGAERFRFGLGVDGMGWITLDVAELFKDDTISVNLSQKTEGKRGSHHGAEVVSRRERMRGSEENKNLKELVYFPLA